MHLRPMDRAGRAVVPCIEPPVVSRPFRAFIVPSRCSADVFGPAHGAGDLQGHHGHDGGLRAALASRGSAVQPIPAALGLAPL